MTLRELCDIGRKKNFTKEESFGLGVLLYYVERLENADKYETMSCAADTLYGILLGLRLSGYISENEFDLLKADMDKLTNDFLERMEMELED